MTPMNNAALSLPHLGFSGGSVGSISLPKVLRPERAGRQRENSGVPVRDLSDWDFDRHSGTLAAGKLAILRVGVPPDSLTTWALVVKCSPVMSPVERLYRWIKPVPKLRSLLPNSGEHFAADAWHTGTNVAI